MECGQKEGKICHQYFYELDGTEKNMIKKFHAIKNNVNLEK